MRDLQTQVPKRVDQNGNEMPRPRLTQGNRVANPNLNPSNQTKNKASDKATRVGLWLLGGGTIATGGLVGWLIS